MLDGLDRLHVLSAGEDVDRSVPSLWPRMDGQVALGDSDEDADAVGLELLGEDVERRGLRGLHGKLHVVPDESSVVQVGSAIPELRQDVRALGFHRAEG